MNRKEAEEIQIRAVPIEHCELEFRLESILSQLRESNLRVEKVCTLVQQLWKLADPFSTKTIFCQPKLKLMSLLENYLSNPLFALNGVHEAPGQDLDFQIIGCLWFLSRAVENRKIIARDNPAILLQLMKRIRIPKYNEMVMNILLNCSLEPVNHPFLLSNELGFLPFLEEQLLTTPTDSDLYRAINYITLSIDNAGANALHYNHLPQLLLRRLFTVGPNPTRWPRRYDGPEYWSLNAIMDISVTSHGARLLRDINTERFLLTLLHNSQITKAEDLKAFIALVNIWYYCDYLQEQSQLGHHYFGPFERSSDNSHDYPRPGVTSFQIVLDSLQTSRRGDYTPIDFLVECFLVTIQFSEKYTGTNIFPDVDEDPMVSTLTQRGWSYGIVNLRTATAALFHCCVLEQQGAPMKSFLTNNSIIQTLWLHPDYWKCQKTLFSLYANGLPGIRLLDTTGYVLAGGGVDDPEVIENLLEILLFLCRYQRSTPPNKKESQKMMREEPSQRAVYDWSSVIQQDDIARELFSSIQKCLLEMEGKALFWKYHPRPAHVKRIRQLLEVALREINEMLQALCR